MNFFISLISDIIIDIVLADEQTSRVLCHHLQFDGSYRSTESMARIINCTPNASIKIPSTKYSLKKSIPAALSIESTLNVQIAVNTCRVLKVLQVA